MRDDDGADGNRQLRLRMRVARCLGLSLALCVIAFPKTARGFGVMKGFGVVPAV